MQRKPAAGSILPRGRKKGGCTRVNHRVSTFLPEPYLACCGVGRLSLLLFNVAQLYCFDAQLYEIVRCFRSVKFGEACSGENLRAAVLLCELRRPQCSTEKTADAAGACGDERHDLQLAGRFP